MATSIAFGLAFATVLVLVVIPSLLSVHESVHEWVKGVMGRLDRAEQAAGSLTQQGGSSE
jgi:hypothetical protein